MSEAFNIALTGHRPNKLGGYDITTPGYIKLQADLEQYIRYQMAEHPDAVIVGHSGLALGADTLWSKAILAMRDKYPDRVKFHAHIPSLQQASRWFKSQDTDFWQFQIDSADTQSLYDDSTGELSNSAVRQSLLDRNTGMIGSADIVLAVHDGTPGGTAHAVSTAERLGRPVVRIQPSNYFG